VWSTVALGGLSDSSSRSLLLGAYALLRSADRRDRLLHPHSTHAIHRRTSLLLLLMMLLLVTMTTWL